eukprot:TRINITY_DN28011_c0_g1_i1.p1 TRINITY_DN28011_c0_g1~~TRINITY_DN28011_c0_g1_i1.p1  ORF type:complete len:576 (+),score=74.70 TRINITY_DN28011_c0_g1_i1:87-1730(+)
MEATGDSRSRVPTRHRLGVYPLGNSLFDNGAHLRRGTGLGCFRRFDDDILLALVASVSPDACSRLACASGVVRAYAWHDDIWRGHCLQLVEDAHRLIWDSEDGTWRATYVRSRGFSRPSGASSERETDVRVYSDVLFRSFYCASLKLDPKWLTRDNLQTVDANSLSVEDFVRRFEQQSCPVVLRGGAASWPAFGRWSKEALLERFGEVSFECGPCELPLRDYFAYADRNCDEAPLFVFDRLFPKRAPLLLDDYEVPTVFRGRDLFDLLGDARPDFRWLLLGHQRSGSKWHIDPNKTSAWNGVVRGKKRWLFLPPGCHPPGVNPSKDGGEVTQPVSLIDWFSSFYGELRRLVDQNAAWDLREGICGAGDVVFVPCGWWHCVINLEDDTLAVTQNYVSETNLHSVRRFLREKREHVSGTREKLTLAEQFDAALARDRPELLEASDGGSVPGVVAVDNSKASSPNENGFSFWSHLRSTGKTLSFGLSKDALEAVDAPAEPPADEESLTQQETPSTIASPKRGRSVCTDEGSGSKLPRADCGTNGALGLPW